MTTIPYPLRISEEIMSLSKLRAEQAKKSRETAKKMF
jgi:hypothetical protein